MVPAYVLSGLFLLVWVIQRLEKLGGIVKRLLSSRLIVGCAIVLGLLDLGLSAALSMVLPIFHFPRPSGPLSINGTGRTVPLILKGLTGLLLLQPLPNQSTMLFIMSRSVAQGRGSRRHVIVVPGEGSIQGLPTELSSRLYTLRETPV